MARVDVARIAPDGLFKPRTTYSQVVQDRTSGVVVTSGQAGVDAEGKLVAPDTSGQFRQILANFDHILASLGVGREAIMKVTIYCTDVASFYATDYRIPGDVSAMAQWAEYFKDAPPASTLVGVTKLSRDDWRIEAEAIIAAPVE